MKFALNDYIDKYIRNAKYTTNKKIARHLKEIIPQTTEEDEPFTAIKIRYKKSSDIDHRYPTFIDFGWHDKFFPAGKNDNYGRTRSLDPSLPDMPEIVHKNLKIAGIIKDIRFLQDKK